MKNELKSEYEYVGAVSSGDFVRDGTLGAVSKGEYIVGLMNLVGYDAIALIYFASVLNQYAQYVALK